MLFEVLKSARDLGMEKFDSIAGIKEKNVYFDQYRSEFLDYIQKKEKLIFHINNEKCKEYN